MGHQRVRHNMEVSAVSHSLLFLCYPVCGTQLGSEPTSCGTYLWLPGASPNFTHLKRKEDPSLTHNFKPASPPQFFKQVESTQICSWRKRRPFSSHAARALPAKFHKVQCAAYMSVLIFALALSPLSTSTM